MIWTIAFWRGAGERALKTFCQTFLAVFFAAVPVGMLAPKLIMELPWATALVTSAMAAFLSLMTSIGNADFTAGGKPAAPALAPTHAVTPAAPVATATATADAGLSILAPQAVPVAPAAPAEAAPVSGVAVLPAGG